MWHLIYKPETSVMSVIWNQPMPDGSIIIAKSFVVPVGNTEVYNKTRADLLELANHLNQTLKSYE
jgi:hypothetical protein